MSSCEVPLYQSTPKNIYVERGDILEMSINHEATKIKSMWLISLNSMLSMRLAAHMGDPYGQRVFSACVALRSGILAHKEIYVCVYAINFNTP